MEEYFSVGLTAALFVLLFLALVQLSFLLGIAALGCGALYALHKQDKIVCPHCRVEIE